MIDDLENPCCNGSNLVEFEDKDSRCCCNTCGTPPCFYCTEQLYMCEECGDLYTYDELEEEKKKKILKEKRMSEKLSIGALIKKDNVLNYIVIIEFGNNQYTCVTQNFIFININKNIKDRLNNYIKNKSYQDDQLEYLEYTKNVIETKKFEYQYDLTTIDKSIFTKIKNMNLTKIIEKTELEKFIESNMFKTNVLIKGAKATGKTYMATKVAEKYSDKVINIFGYDGLESFELIGSYVRNRDGNMIWKDGALSEAFRLASKGKKITIIFDEILRVKKHELSTLIPSLTPLSDGKCHLKTGRIINIDDDVGIEEELIVDPQNIMVIGTTNEGAGYFVSQLDMALKDRFKIYYQELSSKDIKNIISTYTDNLELINTIVNLYEMSQKLVEKEYIIEPLNLRIFSRILKNKQNLKDELLSYVGNFVSYDMYGKPIKKQVDAYIEMINLVL